MGKEGPTAAQDLFGEIEGGAEKGRQGAVATAPEAPAPTRADATEERPDELPFAPSKDDDMISKETNLACTSPEDDMSVLTATTAPASVCDGSLGFRRKLVEIKQFVEETTDW